MKKTIATLCLSALCALLCGFTVEGVDDRADVKGDVRRIVTRSESTTAADNLSGTDQLLFETRYDRQGHLVSINTMFGGETIWAVEYSPVENAAREIVNLDSQKKATGRTVQSFNPDGRLALERIYDQNGALVGSFRYKYDGANCYQTYTDSDDNTVGINCLYYRNGLNTRSVGQKFYRENSFYISDYVYDDRGFLVEAITHLEGGDASPRRYLHSYPEVDTRGNWTRQLIYEEGTAEPVAVTVRTIEYY